MSKKIGICERFKAPVVIEPDLDLIDLKILIQISYSCLILEGCDPLSFREAFLKVNSNKFKKEEIVNLSISSLHLIYKSQKKVLSQILLKEFSKIIY